jgi:hypothetical protein
MASEETSLGEHIVLFTLCDEEFGIEAIRPSPCNRAFAAACYLFDELDAFLLFLRVVSECKPDDVIGETAAMEQLSEIMSFQALSSWRLATVAEFLEEMASLGEAFKLVPKDVERMFCSMSGR